MEMMRLAPGPSSEKPPENEPAGDGAQKRRALGASFGKRRAALIVEVGAEQGHCRFILTLACRT
jgi:hypothetical protein